MFSRPILIITPSCVHVVSSRRSHNGCVIGKGRFSLQWPHGSTECLGDAAGLPRRSSPYAFRCAVQCFSNPFTSSAEAMPNRPRAMIVARTLTSGSAAGPMRPHVGQRITGVRMFRSERIRRSIESRWSGNQSTQRATGPDTTAFGVRQPFLGTKSSVHRPAGICGQF